MNLTKAQMNAALTALNGKLKTPVTLIIGGGGAMILAYDFNLVTTDIDGIPSKGITPDDFDRYIKEVAHDLKIAVDWLNPYYATFTHVLPSDYGTRLVEVFKEKMLTVLALSKTDLLIMKCFAGRMKDRSHAIELIQKGADTSIAEKQIEKLISLQIPKAEKALDFLDEMLDLVKK